MKDEVYRKKLLDAWEGTYKKGQLTLWLFLALRDRPRYVAELKDFIEQATRGSITVEEQSLYRSLRKYRDLEMVDFDLRDGERGPERKYYRLTKLGDEILSDFVERNIALFYDDRLRQLIQNGGNKT
ncbi:PadR family transcriptional regulator [bacterium]|nr:PadR family transcriptional regulator [bacterium]